jgi:hypothetical protein
VELELLSELELFSAEEVEDDDSDLPLAEEDSLLELLDRP